MNGQTPPRRCVRCHDQGFRRKPCPICGALAAGDGRVVYQAGSIFGDRAPAAANPKRPRPDR